MLYVALKETFGTGHKIKIDLFMRYFGRFILNKFDVILNTSWRL